MVPSAVGRVYGCCTDSVEALRTGAGGLGSRSPVGWYTALASDERDADTPAHLAVRWGRPASACW